MFKYVVLISAIILATCAAIFSITGISQLFVGSSLTAALLAGGLELAKLVSVSFLYRYRNELPKFVRLYMTIGVIVIMIITSAGIYGYLASAYAVGSADIQNKQNNITLYSSHESELRSNVVQLNNRITQLQNIRTQQENRIDTLIERGRSITSQQNMIKNQNSEIAEYQKQITKLSHDADSISNLKTNVMNSISTSSKIGTFYYISKVIGVPLDTLIKWFILLLVLVFDPMSISLFIGYNFIVKKESIENFQDYNKPIIENKLTIDTLNDNKNESATTTVKLPTNELPYYEHINYDWKNDIRWRSDPHARAYFQRLGINPLDKK